MTWTVYMVRCARGAFYTGMTSDLPARIKRHNSGRGAKSVKALGLPVVLVYNEEVASRSAALKREAQIKSYSRKQKENLIQRNVA